MGTKSSTTELFLSKSTVKLEESFNPYFHFVVGGSWILHLREMGQTRQPHSLELYPG